MLKVLRKTYKKFNNIHTTCNMGHKHPSKGEASYCATLHLLLRSSQARLKSIQYEKRYDIKVNDIHVCYHLPDFTLVYWDRTEVNEYKGYQTAEFKLKRKLFMACYPDIKYNMIFQKLSNKQTMKELVKLSRKKGVLK